MHTQTKTEYIKIISKNNSMEAKNMKMGNRKKTITIMRDKKKSNKRE